MKRHFILSIGPTASEKRSSGQSQNVLGQKLSSIKKEFLLIILVDILLILLFGLLLSVRSKQSYAQILYTNWNIQIPDNLTEIYEQQGEPSFHGDGPRYHVFQDHNHDTWISFYSSFSDEKNISAEKFMISVLTELEVPPEEWPDFSHSYCWMTKKGEGISERIYFLYDKATVKLYIAEYFT